MELKSHPTRVRGLKLGYTVAMFSQLLQSHPTRVRGLKH